MLDYIPVPSAMDTETMYHTVSSTAQHSTALRRRPAAEGNRATASVTETAWSFHLYQIHCQLELAPHAQNKP